MRGFKELNEELSAQLHKTKTLQYKAPEFKNAFVVYPFSTPSSQKLNKNEFIGVSCKQLNSLPFSEHKNHLEKLVVLQALTFTQRKHYNAHRLLRAIDKNCLLSKLPLNEQTQSEDVLPSREELYRIFSAYPQILKNTEYILESCAVSFVYGKLSNKNLTHYSNSINDDVELLRKLALEGLPYRYPKTNLEVIQRIEKELEIVRDKQFASYYLINWDITQYARKNNFFLCRPRKWCQQYAGLFVTHYRCRPH